MTDIEKHRLDLATKAVRKYADHSGYGHMISDDVCAQIAATVLNSIADTIPAGPQAC